MSICHHFCLSSYNQAVLASCIYYNNIFILLGTPFILLSLELLAELFRLIIGYFYLLYIIMVFTLLLFKLEPTTVVMIMIVIFIITILCREDRAYFILMP